MSFVVKSIMGSVHCPWCGHITYHHWYEDTYSLAPGGHSAGPEVKTIPDTEFCGDVVCEICSQLYRIKTMSSRRKEVVLRQDKRRTWKNWKRLYRFTTVRLGKLKKGGWKDAPTE